MFTNAAVFLLYVGHHASIPNFWTQTLLYLLLLTLALAITVIITMLLRALLTPQTLTPLSNNSQTILSKLLLFPVAFTHTRLTPIKDKFANRFLLLGIPVGLRCRIGNVLAIDDDCLTPHVSPEPSKRGFSWNRVLAHISCWFSTDAVRMLHRGDYSLDLRSKLDSFLREQNEDPTNWPHAYLLTVPKFLSFSRNVVSWWYLYNRERELDALILEINNSYNEKRNVFLRLTSSSSSGKPSVNAPETCSGENGEYLDPEKLIRSLPTASKAKFYTGIWRKQVFASPFEKVDGLVSQRMMDPLSPESWNFSASFSNMTTLDEDSKQVRMATRLTCTQPPLDPTSMSRWELASFLLKWSVPGIFTTLEIIIKALEIKFSGKMKMNNKPPVRSGSVGRYISKLELKLEPFFRAYLTHCVNNCSQPVGVTYLSCRSYTNETITLLSPTAHVRNASSIRSVTIEPVDPAFYTRITSYTDVKTALVAETKMTGHVADPTARRLLVSDLDLLLEIVDSSNISCKQDRGRSLGPSMGQRVLGLSRGMWNKSSFMDAFVFSSSSTASTRIHPLNREEYITSILRLSAAQKFAFSSQRLLNIYILIVSCLLRWTLLNSLVLISKNIINILPLNFPPLIQWPRFYLDWAPWLLVTTTYFAILELSARPGRLILRSL